MKNNKIRIFRDNTTYANRKDEIRVDLKYLPITLEGYYGIELNGKIINISGTEFEKLITIDDDGNWVIRQYEQKDVNLLYKEEIPAIPQYYINDDGEHIEFDGPILKEDNNYYILLGKDYPVKRTFITESNRQLSFNEIYDHYEKVNNNIYYVYNNKEYYEIQIEEPKHEITDSFDSFDSFDDTTTLDVDYLSIGDDNKYYYINELKEKVYVTEDKITKVYVHSSYSNGITTIYHEELLIDEQGNYYYLNNGKQIVPINLITNMYVNKININEKIIKVKFEIQKSALEYTELEELNQYMKKYSVEDLVKLKVITYNTLIFGSIKYPAYPEVPAIPGYWYYINGDKEVVVDNTDLDEKLTISVSTSIIVNKYPAIQDRYVTIDNNNNEILYIGDPKWLTVNNDEIYIDCLYDNINDYRTYYIIFNNNKRYLF